MPDAARDPVQSDRFALFEQLVRKRCDIRTLRTRGRDSLDFHDVSVWALVDLMNSAYEAGYKAAEEEQDR